MDFEVLKKVHIKTEIWNVTHLPEHEHQRSQLPIRERTTIVVTQIVTTTPERKDLSALTAHRGWAIKYPYIQCVKNLNFFRKTGIQD
jgi:hypothetical protein